MQLPGGIRIDGELRESFRFKPVTGLLELTLSESALHACTHPARVTSVLCEALEELGGMAPSAALVRELSVGDRQFLMRSLAVHIDDQPVWLTARCGKCTESFDLSFKHSELPVKPAGRDYPETVVETTQGSILVRVPTGSDQEAVAAIQKEGKAVRALLRRLISRQGSGEPLNIKALSKGDIQAIEAAAEEMAPEITQNLLIRCPHCSEENEVPLTPYACMERPVGNLYSEVHTLAANYHWSEHDILMLPRNRRHTYLSLIDSSRGMNTSENFERVG